MAHHHFQLQIIHFNIFQHHSFLGIVPETPVIHQFYLHPSVSCNCPRKKNRASMPSSARWPTLPWWNDCRSAAAPAAAPHHPGHHRSAAAATGPWRSRRREPPLGGFFWWKSLDWFKGKSTGNHSFSHEIWVVPIIFPLNQSNEEGLGIFLGYESNVGNPGCHKPTNLGMVQRPAIKMLMTWGWLIIGFTGLPHCGLLDIFLDVPNDLGI